MLRRQNGPYFIHCRLSLKVFLLSIIIVCIYVPFQQSLAVRKRVVGILNALSKDRFYTIDDIEELSTVVLLTNIPYDVSDKTMDLLIEGFGTTLSKVGILDRYIVIK